MGCDIHLQIEVKKKGKWVWVNEFLPKGLDKSDYIPLDTGRNYNLFAVLADVRNGYGFAGCETGEGFIPISKPKGLPEDMSDSLKKANDEEYLLGDHSYSYLSADELHNYDWERMTRLKGFVTAKQYKIYKAIGRPEKWCGGVGGGQTKIVDNAEMDQLIKCDRATDNHYTQISWDKSYKYAIGFDTYYDYQNLRDLICWDDEGKEIEDIRIVFGFDS